MLKLSMKVFCKNEFFLHLIIFIFFILLTTWYFLPLLSHFTSYLPGDYDELNITWAIYSTAQKFPAWPEKLFQGNVFYPHPFSRAYSDPLITAGLIAKPFIEIYPEPIIAFNINLILSQVLTLFFTYLFLNQLTKDKKISVVLATIFSFSLIHLHYLHHLNYFAIQWLSLSGFFLLKLGETKKPFWIYSYFFIFILQTLNSFLLGYFVLFLSSGLYLFDQKIRKSVQKNLYHLIFGLVISLLILFPFINIYLKVSRHFNYLVPITDIIHFSLSPEELITKFFSPVLYLITLIAAVSFITNKKYKNYRQFLGFAILLIISLILSLGPALHWMRKTIKIPFHIPLPYLLFYFLVPGFKGIRVPSRWILMTALAATSFGALGLKNIFLKFKKIKNWALVLILFLFLITIKRFNNYVSIPQIKNYPPVYSWLKRQKGETIIELPINTWGQGQASKQETYRMLYSLLHKKNLVNGYGSYTPLDYYQLVSLFKNNFPSQEAIDLLKKMEVDYLILHKDEYAKIWPEEKLNQLNKIKGIKLVASFGPDLVYQL